MVLLAVFAIPAMAVTTNMTSGGYAYPTDAQGKTYVLANTIDFATHALASNDTINVLNVPADTVVNFVEYKVLTTNDASSTFNIGDAASASRWKASADANTKGAVLGTATPYLYTTVTNINININATTPATKGTVRVRAFCTDVSK